MANNRIYYAIQQVALGSGNSKVAVHGLQSVGLTTNFNLEQVFELGQLSIYQNVETIPDIEVTLNKVLDGYPLLYVLATEAGSVVGSDIIAQSPDLAGRQNARVDMELAIFNELKTSATGTAFATVNCEGMYVSSVSYTFPVDGNFTEDVTLVGNNKVWSTSMASGWFNDNDDPAANEGVNRRQHLNMGECVFPTQIPGISGDSTRNNDGFNPLIANGSGYGVHFQNITVSTDLGREAIYELGTMVPYHRYVTFPVEVTCEFEVIATSGDGINASESGYYTGDYTYGSQLQSSGSWPYQTGQYSVADYLYGGVPQCSGRFNLLDQKIYLETCEGTKIYLGTKNKLTSVNYTGGDTGGGNVTITYSYSNFNDFVVAHSGGRVGLSGAGNKTAINNYWYGVSRSGYRESVLS